MSSTPLTFTASIAPLQSAITIASDGGARVKIDIPEEEMPAIVRLMLFRGIPLRITVEPLKNKPDQNGTTQRHNKQSKWTPAQEQGDDGYFGDRAIQDD